MLTDCAEGGLIFQGIIAAGGDICQDDKHGASREKSLSAQSVRVISAIRVNQPRPAIETEGTTRMAGTPTYAVPPTFLGITRTDLDADFVIAGIPMDIGTTNRSGTRDGPAAIRRASRMLTDGDHPEHRVEPARMSVSDIGDFALALGDIPGSLTAIQARAESIDHLIALGGEHGITLPLLRALTQRLGHPVALVHFDAHVDTWPDNFGQAYAHGSPFYHAINEGLIDPRRMIQIGIRSPVQTEVMEWTVSRGVTVVSARTSTPHPPAPSPRGSPRSPATSPPISASTSMRSTRPSRREPAPRKSAVWRPGRRRRSCGGSSQFVSLAWTSWRFPPPTMSRRSPLWPPRQWFGSILRC